MRSIVSYAKKNSLVLSGITASGLLAAFALYNIQKRLSIKHHAQNNIKQPMDAPKYSLTKEMAEKRRLQITGDVKYDILLRINKGTKYQGKVAITFHFTCVDPEAQDFMIEYLGDQISEVEINGIGLFSLHSKGQVLKDNLLFIPKKMLKENSTNTILVSFENSYAKDGFGFHSFIDTDSNQYIYSNFAPHHAFKMFPCFDQPDIKGTYSLTVYGPSEWDVISNEILRERLSDKPASQIALTKGDNKFFLLGDPNEKYSTFIFETTKPISTYLFVVIAGPFKKIECENPQRSLPLALYCRESLYEHLQKDVKMIFEVTLESMKWYEDFFGYPFPFSKYDQIFCPEFQWAAMENPGAVIFNDNKINRSQQRNITRDTNFCNTIAHELSHMWFGNLVTNKWWNDLWLNESFAEFISHFCLSHLNLSQKINDLWVSFNGRKNWGYRDDELPTTHPIAGDINNTEEAENIFDGITYAKGAAVLSQLVALIGEKKFSEGLKRYFKNYQWSNATIHDFFASFDDLSQFGEFDTETWKQQWICTAGLNQISAHIKDGLLTIEQKPVLQAFPTLRYHKMQIAFFYDPKEAPKVVPLLIPNKPETSLELKDLVAKPNAVLLNYRDQAFAKCLFDKESLGYFIKNLAAIPDQLTRLLVWKTVYKMVYDSRISSLQYIDLFLKNSSLESDDGLLQEALSSLYSCIYSWSPKKECSNLASKLFIVLLPMLKSCPIENESRVSALKSYIISFASSDTDIRVLFDWINNELNPEFAWLSSVKLNVYDQWAIVKKVHKNDRFSREEKEILFKAQAERDNSDMRVASEHECQNLCIANESQRREAWDFILNEADKLSVKLAERRMAGFADGRHGGVERYHEKYFEVLLEVFQKKPKEFAKSFSSFLFPSTDDFTFLLRKIEEVKAATPKSEHTLLKFLTEQSDFTKRRMNTIERFLEESASKIGAD